MLRLSIRINGNWRAAVLLACLLLSLSLVGSAGALQGPAVVSAETALAYAPRGTGRHFYLTNASYPCNQVLTACGSGYHMASLWEILDVSNLIYDYDHPAAHRKDDSGQGPPSFWHGWVRTGWSSNATATVGTGNCNNWTSVSTSDHGVAVRLSRTWETAPGDIFVWDANDFTCNYAGPVWCVADVEGMYLPLILRAH